MASSANIRKRAKQLKGQPVRVELHDGRSYIGWIAGLDANGLVLSIPPRGKKKMKKKKAAHSKKARSSAIQQPLDSGLPRDPRFAQGIHPDVGWGLGGVPMGYGPGPGGNWGRPRELGYYGNLNGGWGRPQGYYGFSGMPGRPGPRPYGYGFAGGPGRPRRPGLFGFGGSSGSEGSGGTQEQNTESSSSEGPRRPGIFGMVQKVQKYMPLMKMGYNAIKSIIPLFNGIKALMV
ncbi:hypothetical protein P9H28_00255 [Paenibacillus barengoltzii]|uniref:hypothetical protein n=1 Tax=Paenibacillus barengoltzii TaxID=343517 RepID=UPI002DBA6D29|nr:hypothetical protein [Paenibacillus barengoltzii]MEC2342533.1 hypothetical protein [Paenibacillus barengoltzii]